MKKILLLMLMVIFISGCGGSFCTKNIRHYYYNCSEWGNINDEYNFTMNIPNPFYVECEQKSHIKLPCEGSCVEAECYLEGYMAEINCAGESLNEALSVCKEKIGDFKIIEPTS